MNLPRNKIARLLVLGAIAVCAAPVQVASAQPRQAGKTNQAQRAGNQNVNRDSLRARWQKMSKAEREQFEANARAWKNMRPEDRQLMNERLQRLEAVRAQAEEDLPAPERSRISRLDERERRRALDRQTQEMLRKRLQQLPPEMRRRMRSELAGRSPSERREITREMYGKVFEASVTRRLDAFEREGLLPQTDIERARRGLRSRRPSERFQAMRGLMVRHPDQFGIERSDRDRLRKATRPEAAMRLLGEIERSAPNRRRLERLEQFLRENNVPSALVRKLKDASNRQDRAKAMEEIQRRYGKRLPADARKVLSGESNWRPGAADRAREEAQRRKDQQRKTRDRGGDSRSGGRKGGR